VRDLHDEYVSHAHGKLTLVVADPEPFTPTEEEATSAGLSGIPLPSSASGEMIYFGLAGSNSTGQEEVIPFFSPEREESLEYDITKIVYNLAHPKKKVVGVITTLPMDGNPMARMMNPRAQPEDPWVVLDQLRDGFEVKMIQPTAEELDKDLDVLVIVHPQNLSNPLLYAIDQYVLGGGKVVAFIDPYCEAQEVHSDPQNPMAAMMADRSSSLGVLGDAWGIEMVKDQLAGDKDLALGVNMGNGQPVDYIVYLGLTKEKKSFDDKDFTTTDLQRVNLAFAGVLRAKEGATTTISPLMHTTKSSMQVPKSKIQFQTAPSELLSSFQSAGEEMMLAARITGPAKTAFPDGKPKSATDKPDAPTPLKPEESLKESKGPINVIVVSDVDMLTDRLWVQVQKLFGQRLTRKLADNGSLLVNAVDNLSGSNDLISLRSRGRSQRPFDKVVELRRDATAKFQQKQDDFEAKLRDTEKKLNDLQGNKDAGSALIMSPEQNEEIKRLRDEKSKTRKELRNVQLELNTDQQSLKNDLVLINGFSVPVLVLIAGVLVWYVRRGKMQTAREASLRS
jgi:ABC-type uncharacterized transport system involved in gliding motility auxiliary subunit